MEFQSMIFQLHVGGLCSVSQEQGGRQSEKVLHVMMVLDVSFKVSLVHSTLKIRQMFQNSQEIFVDVNENFTGVEKVLADFHGSFVGFTSALVFRNRI